MFNLEKSVQRLQWRFGTGKAFKPNENDAKALNTIFEWIDNQKKEDVLKHSLFIKLYIYQLTTIIRQYESDILESICQKELHRMIEMPLKSFTSAFYRDLQGNQAKRLIDRINPKGVDAVDLTKEDIKTLSTEILKEKYTEEDVENRLLNMATDALNRFS